MTAGRLDAALVARGLATGREKAKEYIAAGAVLVNGQVVCKAAASVRESDEIVYTGEKPRYVGRGGYKLEKALALAPIDPQGKVAMDVGASTGGFTDCLLQHGAAQVFAVDVGHGQLHASLRADPRVRDLEGIDSRDTERLRAWIDPASVQFCVLDVSFISIKTVFPALVSFLAPMAQGVCLIKPQFEAGRSAVGKNGVVRDPRVHRRVLEDIGAFLAQQGCRLLALDFSPITGGEGNIEYLAVWERPGAEPQPLPPRQTDAVVQAAHQALRAPRE